MSDTTNINFNEKSIKELIRLGQLIATPQQVGQIAYAVIPQDSKIESLEKLQFSRHAATPERKSGTVTVLDASGFIEYFTLFNDSNSRVFADETKSSVLAVLDYHGAGDGGPRWCEHRVRLVLRPSDEWKTWTGKNGIASKMTQLEFAEFIENNTPDITNPSAATMLEMARSLEAKVDVDYASAVRLNNGQVQLSYTEQVKGTYGSGKVEIPEEFTIQIPVYVGGPRVLIRARLRYRLVSGKLTIWYDLLRPEEVQRRAFLDTLTAIRDGISVVIINGTPE